MIRVLHKAFDILEYLAKEPQRRKKLTEIAGNFKMNAGTCANILKTMVKRGLVDQEKARGGYLLGPMIYYLSRLSPYREDLVTAAGPVVDELVKKVNETVLLVILRGNKRFTVIQNDGTRSIQLGREMFFQDNIYETATGRLLLSYLGKDELDAFLAEMGLPGSSWPEADSRKKLKIALEKIRRQGLVLHQPSSELIGIAYPVSENGKVIAALGLFLPAFRFKGAHKAAIIKGMPKAAAAVSERMSVSERK